MTTTIRLTQPDPADPYRWGECSAQNGDRVCRNTVKFAGPHSDGLCPACSTLYRADGSEAIALHGAD